MSDKQIKTWPEIFYTATAEPHGYWVDFVIYEVSGLGDDGPDWTTPDLGSTDKLEEAKVFAHGSVKWDGCSNWIFDDSTTNFMTHGCCRRDLENIGKVLTSCWDWAGELMPEHWHV